MKITEQATIIYAVSGFGNSQVVDPVAVAVIISGKSVIVISAYRRP